MNAVKDHLFALKRSFELLIKGHFLLFFLPGVVIAILFIMYTQGLKSASESLNFVSHIPWVGNYMQGAVDTVFGWIEGISIFIYQFTIITLLSPFHTVLSERVDEKETGIKFKSGWEKFFTDLLRTIGIALLGGIIYMFVKLIWWLFSWSLGLSFLDPYISLIVLGFFTGFNSYDYSLERYGASVGKSWVYAFSHPLYMIITGVIFSLLLMIPYVGVVIAPVILTMVGTLCYLRIEQRKKAKLTQTTLAEKD
ncbi:MAG: EI24 domain-containing protein [Brumimicrobium sp.]|nr:EI24 domain-containing protein [Brumimicrobium sp.]